MIIKYNQFILESEFSSILFSIYNTNETNNDNWESTRSYEWDLRNKNKMKDFLSKLNKEQVREYFHKFINWIKSLPKNISKPIIIAYSSIFISIAPLSYLIQPGDKIDNDIKELISQPVKLESDFHIAQDGVKEIEAGYSDDRSDRGNWIGNRFIGTNHGISAIILKDHLGRMPKKEDMENLAYDDAVSIYKEKYWNKQNLSLFSNQSVANIIYDGCVNQGISGMKYVLNNVYNELGVDLGGKSPFDTESIYLTNEIDQKILFDSIKKWRSSRYDESITRKKHGEGWKRRLDTIKFSDK